MYTFLAVNVKKTRVFRAKRAHKRVIGRIDAKRNKQFILKTTRDHAGGFFFGHFNFPHRDKSTEGEENNSIWAVVSGIATGFNLPINYVLYELSYANVVMYGATFPSTESKKENKKKRGVINADDPKNRDLIRKIYDES